MRIMDSQMNAKVLDDISHRRFNPLRGCWVLVSPHRMKRPWQGQQELSLGDPLPEYDPKCYLCPGNIRANGERNPQFDKTFIFVNDYSAVKEEQADYKPDAAEDGSSSLLRAETATGRCYVLTFSAKHNTTLADMSAAEILPVINAWTEVYASHLSSSNSLRSAFSYPYNASSSSSTIQPSPPAAQLRYMQIFENKGAAMGCSNPHPHCQMWTTSYLPEEPAAELAEMSRYRAKHSGRHLLGDYVQLELNRGERVVWKSNSWAVLCPWWGVWPFETLVVPRRHVRALVDLNEEEKGGLAEAVAQVTRRYDNLFKCSFPYSSGIHQAPLDGTSEEVESSYLHIHFYPPLLRSATVKKFLVGFELLAEPQRDITPEQATARLQTCGGEIYRTSK